jgi:hypothetical protein
VAVVFRGVDVFDFLICVVMVSVAFRVDCNSNKWGLVVIGYFDFGDQ